MTSHWFDREWSERGPQDQFREAIGESLATVPASPVTLEAAGRPLTVPAQIIPTWVDRDDECSVSSESCWGELEDLIGDELVEWGVHSVPDEDGSIAPVVNHSESLLRAFGLQESCVGPSPLEGHPNQCRICTELKLSWQRVRHNLKFQSSAGHRELPASRAPPQRLKLIGVPSTVPESSNDTNVIPSGRFSVLSKEMEISTANDRNSADTQRVERGADGESDTQTVPSMDGESGATAASGDDPGGDVDNVEPSFEDLAPAAGVMRAGFMSLDAVDFEDFFRRRAMVMKSVPRFLRGPFRSVLRIALQEALSPNAARCERGWKLLMAAPRMFLSKPPRELRQQRQVDAPITRGVVGFDL